MVSVIRYVFYIAVVAILIAILDTNYKMSDKVNDSHIKISNIEQKVAMTWHPVCARGYVTFTTTFFTYLYDM